MGNTVPPRVSREATGGRRGAGTGCRRPENVDVVTEAAPSRVVAVTARKQGRDDDDVEEETTRAGRALRAGGGDDAAAPGKVLAVRIVMGRKDAEALVARLKAQSARARKARMAELRSELRAGSGGGGGARRGAGRPSTLPPIEENRCERTPVVRHH